MREKGRDRERDRDLGNNMQIRKIQLCSQG